MDIDQLDTMDGDNYEDIMRHRKVYFNIVDGLPSWMGYVLDKSGVIQNKSYDDKLQTSYLSNANTFNQDIKQILFAAKAPLNEEDLGCTEQNYHVIANAITLAGGAAANEVLIPNVAGQKIYALWAVWMWDTAPAAAYTIHYEDPAGTTTNRWVTYTPTMCGQKTWIFHTSAAANTALVCDITGGAGAENLYFVICYDQH